MRRSVATGEASFPRSDVDLGIVVHDASGTVVADIADRASRLRRVVPVLGEIQLYDIEDLDRWTRIDTYRGSLDRRSAYSVHGPPPKIPDVPIRAPEAFWRMAFWLETNLPRAIARDDATNLRKFALEAVNAHAVATGALEEPPLRRASATSLPAARLLPETQSSPTRWLQAFFDVVADARGTESTAVEPVPPGAYPLTVPGSGARTRLVVLGSSRASPPPESRLPGAITVTPQALDVLVAYVNPALWYALPAPVAASVRPPSEHALRRQALSLSSLWRLCAAGLHPTDPGGPARRLALAADLASGVQTESDWTPPEPDPELVSSSREDYYARVYPKLRARRIEVAATLGAV